MECCRRRECSWWKSSSWSSSMRLFWFMGPLILVSGFMVFLGSNWSFVSQHNYNPWVWSSVISLACESTAMEETVVQDPVSFPKDNGENIDLKATAASRGNNGEAALADCKALSFLNRSAPPPLAVEPIHAQQQQPAASVENKENKIFPFLNDSHSMPISERLSRNYSNLQRLESSLAQARAAVREAILGNETHDAEYIPKGPMYLNANAFHRSYLEMEKQFKIFVYEEGEQPIFHNGPCKSIYAMEGNFIYLMETTYFRTRDPDKAHVYFLPISVTAMVRFIYESNSHNWNPLRQTFRDYVNLLSKRYPYWNRSLGADHFMLACHDWGPELSSSVPDLFKNSIRALCNANTSEGFKPSKDVSFPEILLPGGTMEGLLGGPSPSKRPFLLFFAGGLHGPIRSVLLEHWENKDQDVQIHRYLPKGVSYYGMMRKSKYCICASGYEVASPRMVEAIYTGCIPVLIKDHYVPPFSDVLNWKAFSVEIPVKDIPNLKEILVSISARQYIRMQRRVLQVRRHFEVNSPPKRYDVFHMILHSVWLRRLNFRVHDNDEL